MKPIRSTAAVAALAAVAATGQLALTGAAAAPLAGTTGAAMMPRPGPVLVQGSGPSVTDRMRRLHQHRAILESALAPGHTMPAEPPQPQTGALQPPPAAEAPQPQTQPPPSPPAAEPPQPQTGSLQPPPAAEAPQPQTGSLQQPPAVDESQPIGPAHGQVSCEAAAAIVADYGFSDIHPTDCSGELYTFAATRDGTDYALTVTASDGEIAEVDRQ